MLALALLPTAGALGQASLPTSGRIEILGWQNIFEGGILTTRQPSHTFTNFQGDTVSLRVTPVVPGVIDYKTDTVALTQPLVLTVAITARRTYAAVGGVISASIRVHEPFQGTVCEQSSPGTRINAGSSGTFSAELSCTFSVVHSFNQSFDTARVELDTDVSLKEQLDGTAPGGFGWALAAHYYRRLNENTLQLFVPTPSPQVPLSVRPLLTFSGTVFQGLGTVDTATVKVYVLDQDGRIAGSTTVPFKLNDFSKQFTIANVRLPQKPGLVRVYAQTSTADLVTELATATVTYNAIQGCDLNGTLAQVIEGADNQVNPVPDVKVELLDAADAVKGVTQAKLGGSVKAPTSTYCFALEQPLDQAQRYRLRVTLQDGQDQPHLLAVTDDPAGRKPFTIVVPEQPFPIPATRIVDVKLPSIFNDEDSVAVTAYWNFWRQLYLLTPASLHEGFQPGRLDVVLTDRKLPTYCLEPVLEEGCVSFNAAYLAGADEYLGTRFFVAPISATLYGAHLAYQLYGGRPPLVANPSDPLARSPAEGFPLFWKSYSAYVLGGAGEPETEPNEKIDRDVALGVGGLLWDLFDLHVDAEFREKGSNKIYADQAALAVKDITGLLASQRAKDLRVFRQQLLAAPFLLDQPRNPAEPDSLSVLDNVYGLHLKASTPLPTRRALAAGDPALGLPPSGAAIEVTLVDPAGQPVDATVLEVRFEYGGGAESLNTTELRNIVAGTVPFTMPPQDYEVRALLSVAGSDAPPLVIENAVYWAAVPNDRGSFLAHTFVVPDVPQVFGLLPNAARAGSRVRILGRGFSPAVNENAVTIGPARAAVVSAGATELVVEVPRALTRGAVTVTVGVGGRASNESGYFIEAPALSVAETALSYGSVAVGQSVEKTLTVSNRGDAPLEITGLETTSGDFNAPLFAVPTTVEPGETRAISIRFAPTAAGTRSGTLVLSTNDNVRRTAAIPLIGTGTTAAARGLVFTPGALGFGQVALNGTRTFTVSLRNADAVPRTVSAVSATLPAFRLVSPAVPFTLQAGESRDLTVELKPTSNGVQYGALLFSTDDPLTPQVSLALAGEGVSGTPAVCGFGVTPASVSLPAEGGSAVVAVTASAGCAWTSSSGGAAFATVSGSATGTGSATVTATRNTGGLRANTVTVAGILVEVRQGGASADSETFVPIVLSTAGLGGTFFSSELTLTNRGAQPALIELTYTAAFGGGGGTARDVIPAGGQLIFPDALAYLRSLGVDLPATGNRGGTLRVKFVGAANATATVRTASIVPEGRAGLAYGGVAREAQLTGTAYLTGLRQTDADRTNVAVLNTGTEADGGLVYRVTVFSGDPAHPGSRVFEESLPPGGFRQFTEILRDLPFSQGYARVERIGGNAPFTCYAVINDRANGDGSFVPPVAPETLTGKAGLTLPVAVEAGPFDSEVVVTNFGTAPRSVTLTFVSDAINAAGNSASLPLALAAGEQRLIPSFVQALRQAGAAGIGTAGAASYAGAVFLSVASGDVSGLAIGARTSSPGGGGRYGLFYTGVPSGAGASGDAWLFGLQQNTENRSNLAIVSTGEVDGSASDYGISIFDGDTGQQVAYVPVNGIGPRRWTQISGILTSRAPGVTSAYAKVSRISGNNPFLTYAVINDGGSPGQRTGDGAFVAMEVARSAQ